MAREIPERPQPPPRSVDWSSYDTGTTWELVAGEDFDQTPRKAAHAARQWCYYHHRSAAIRVLPDRITIFIHPE